MLAGRTPAGRLTTPADVADAVALLCATEAAWIHGQVITVDGGLGLRA
jgi:enoyl-[acyl-carrier protein] reductase III